jgi:hypothetical protein
VSEFLDDDNNIGMTIEVETNSDKIKYAAEKYSPNVILPILVIRNAKSHDVDNDIVNVIFPTAIARFLASTTTTTTTLLKDSQSETPTTATIVSKQLLGATHQQTNEINRWIDLSISTLELPACLSFYPVVGYLPATDRVQQASNQAKIDLAAVYQFSRIIFPRPTATRTETAIRVVTSRRTKRRKHNNSPSRPSLLLPVLQIAVLML